MRKLIVLFLLLVSCRGAAENQGSAFDRAAAAQIDGRFRDAAQLFATAAASESDAERHEAATLRLANIEWRVFHDHAAARARLQKLDSAKAHVELARLAADLKDYAAVRAEAGKATALATNKRERLRAAMTLAEATALNEKAFADELRATIATLRRMIADEGPRLGAARTLARAAIRVGDGAAALEGIAGYYHVSPYSGPPAGVAAGYAVLAQRLPSWKGGADSAIAEGLTAVRFFDEAALVAPSSDVAAYAAALRRIRDLTNEYYRQIALGEEHDKVLRDGVDRGLAALRVSRDALAKRYGTYVNVGKTGNHVDLHLGHAVVDSSLRVEQYGQTATVRFVALDEMTSNGFSQWASDGASGDGGWATSDVIYQVRPRYADSALYRWSLVTDPEERAEEDKKIREESERDRQRAKENPIRYFPGLARRLERQYLDSVRNAAPSREAFVARVESDEFESSIARHEGRHAIDHRSGTHDSAWQLEYRAKLSEIALAPAPRQALSQVLDYEMGGSNPHPRANLELAKGLVAWMDAHRAEIAGYDTALPPLPQIDRLTDDQLRAAVRELDPLAKR